MKFWLEKLFCGVFSRVKRVKKSITIQLFKSKSQYRTWFYQMRWKRNQDITPILFHRIWKILFLSFFSGVHHHTLLNLDKMWWRQLCRHKQQTHETTSLSYFSLTTVCTLAGGFLKAFQAEKILASTLAFMDPSHLNFSSPSLLAITTDFFRC